MQRFLTFIVEGKLTNPTGSETLKESVIGMAVFDRPADYDPRGDPVVRVEARRLRSKLEEYYEAAGNDERIRIEIPVGSYVPVWRRRSEIADDVELATPKRPRSWRYAGIGLVLVLAIAAAFLVWTERRNIFSDAETATANAKILSLAVLPFQNLTRDSAQEYLINGLTDEITTNLAKIRTLKVISRTSAQFYRSTHKRLPEIARELNVDAVVEGSVMSSQNRVRVTAQLVRAATDTHLWAETYQRDAGDMFTLQAEIAENIARQIGATIEPVLGGAANEQTINPEAYESYLRGRYFWNKRTLDGLERSIGYFQRAIQVKPDYASAYAALGAVYVLLNSYGSRTSAESFTRARTAAEQALRLDPSLAEAHTVLGAIKASYDWDWPAATAEYRRALELNPGYPTAHHWYSLHLSRLGRHKEAEAEIQRALEIDPLSLIINTDAGETYYWTRRPDPALLHLRKALELDPNFAQAHLVLGKVYEQKKQFALALTEFDRVAKMSDDGSNGLLFRAHALALSGKPDEALRIAKELEDGSTLQYVPSVGFTFVYCALGAVDRAMEWLERAYQERGNGIDFIGTEPLFDGCRSDSRFQDLIRRLHLMR